MTKINEIIKNKLHKNREKKIMRIENNILRGKNRFIIFYGIILWTPLWLFFWFMFIDLKILNLFINKPLNEIENIFSDPLNYFILRIPVAAFLGYTNAVTHWHYLFRRLKVLKKKSGINDDEEDFYISG